ncbi:uncharacterized protein LOC136749155 [Amia ocellicauda]|uniref:uncharacterized protein LOC136749155 n=1 Tax=Amia ocellicauda TaxID=2972642 RepID=UPI0034639D3F
MEAVVLLLVLSLDSFLTEGQSLFQLTVGETFRIAFIHDRYYNENPKYCCKILQGLCYKLINTKGFISENYYRRANLHAYNGGMELKIIHIEEQDSGVYRCGIDNTIIVHDFYLRVSVPDNLPLHPPEWSSTTTTFKATAPATSTSTAARQHDSNGSGRSTNDDTEHRWIIPLGAALTVLALTLIAVFMVVAVCRRRKVERNKCGTAECEPSASLSPDSSCTELHNITYSTVVFNPNPSNEPLEIYANLRTWSPPESPPRNASNPQSADTVEYSTVAIRNK